MSVQVKCEVYENFSQGSSDGRYVSCGFRFKVMFVTWSRPQRNSMGLELGGYPLHMKLNDFVVEPLTYSYITQRWFAGHQQLVSAHFVSIFNLRLRA